MSHTEKEAIIKTFVRSNFNCGCLIWHFSPKIPQIKVEKFMKLKFLSNDYLSSYSELTSASMETKRLRRIVYNSLKH